jgi:hypothetical protein
MGSDLREYRQWTGCFDFVHKCVAVFCLNSHFLLNVLRYILSVTLPMFQRFGIGNQPYSYCYLVGRLTGMFFSKAAIPNL